MKVYEFGTEHEKTFVMFQCAAEPWWVFRDSAEAMARDYHVYLVIADGHDEQGTTFVSIEKNVSDAAAYLRAKGVRRIDGLYGVSMGGASAMRFLATYAPALLPEGQAPAAPGWNPEDSPGLVAPALWRTGATAIDAPALLPEGQAPAAPGWNPKDSPGLVAPALWRTGATAIEDIPVEKAIIDAGITPYPYPKWVCRLIALKDWATVMLGTKCYALLKLAYPPERWTPKGQDPEEHYRRIFEFEKHHFSSRTIYNTFWSTNNYSMPDPVPKVAAKMEYWYGEEERKARKNDLAWARRAFPQIVPREFKGLAHAELVLMFPERFRDEVMRFMNGESV